MKSAFEKLIRNTDYMQNVTQFLEVKGDQVHCKNPQSIENIRSLVACIGPPGAGKSTLCNSLFSVEHGSKLTFFEPSASITSYTKGLWVLSNQTRMALPGNLRWEVMDMEGFQVDLASSWKMAMVLSLLAEIVIFCNRDARCDNLFKAATVFEKGRELSTTFGMKPVTTQIFVQIEEGTAEEDKADVVKKIREVIPGIEIIPFEIPQIRNKNKKDHEFVTFHAEVLDATKVIVKKFKFTGGDAVASKARSVANLLEAFNEGDFLKVADMSSDLLKTDCERIFKAHLAIYRNEQIQRALLLKLKSLETSLEEFAGTVAPFTCDFTQSNFYVVGRSEEFIEKLLDELMAKEKIDPLQFYRPMYNDKIQDLQVQKEREAKITNQAEKEFMNEVNEVIEASKALLLKHIGTLKFHQKIEGDGSKWLKSKEMDIKGKKLRFVPDYTSYFLFVQAQQVALQSMWAAQVAKAQWKAPCAAIGRMECTAGHKLKDQPAIICDKKMKDEMGNEMVCGGQWYWVDGPEQYSMCNGKCQTVKRMDPGLICYKCKANLLCQVRTSDYFP